MKAFVLFIAILFTATTYAQNTVNSYKYVSVPERFSFAKTDDQYNLNTLTRLLFEDIGFTVYMGNTDVPPAVAANRCAALTADVTERKTIFVTYLTLQLKDCYGNIVFKSKEGKSREKEFQAAYNEAMRDAFSSLKNLPYKYDSTAAVPTQQPVATPMPPSPATPGATPASVTEAASTLYAQATPNGYQLIDTTPKKVMTLFKTSLSDYFIADDGTSNGVVFKKNGEWFFECYKDNKLISQKLTIKF